jgi:ABC-2 type transport system ATP-binding protein
MGNAIEAMVLNRRYGELLAVDHVNLQVENGEAFGFLGPNRTGSGREAKTVSTKVKPSIRVWHGD